MRIVFFDSPDNEDLEGLLAYEPEEVVVSTGSELNWALDNEVDFVLIVNRKADDPDLALDDPSVITVVTGKEWDEAALSLCTSVDVAVIRWDESPRASQLVIDLAERGTTILDLGDGLVEVEVYQDPLKSSPSSKLSEDEPWEDLITRIVESVVDRTLAKLEGDRTPRRSRRTPKN